MRIGEASSASRVSARALRYYEDAGLIVPGRISNGYRDYCQSTIEQVRVIRSLLESGLSVRLIKTFLLRLAESADADSAVLCAEFLPEVERYRDRLTARIADLTSQKSALDAYLRRARHSGH